jgi:shikimate kinase
MYKPILLVIAGCNGSGKSSFSHILAEDNFSPFDSDLHYLHSHRFMNTVTQFFKKHRNEIIVGALVFILLIFIDLLKSFL